MNRKASMIFIFVTLAVDAIGLGIIIPVLPDVVRRFIHDEGSLSRTFGYFIALYALLQFATSPVLGRLSDKYGRRPVLLLSLFGAAVDYLFMAFAPTLPLLFLGRIISGVSGASFTVANAYIADISDDSNRSKNFGVIGAGFGLGFILGPALGGFLAARGPQYPFLAAAVFNFLNFAFGYFVLPESLPPEKRRAFDARAINPFRALKALGNVKGVAALVGIYFLMNLAGQTHPTMWALYTNHRYGWGATEIGFSLALVGILSAISQGGLTGPLVKKFGEAKLVIFGCFGETISFALIAFSTKGWMMYAVFIVGSIFWSAQPALQALMTKEVPETEQGEFQGALMSLVSLTAILNPLMTTTLFSLTSDRTSAHYFPGSPYLLSCGFLVVATVWALRWRNRQNRAA